MSRSTEKKIRHYQRSIDKSIIDRDRLRHCIKKLRKLPVTVQHLQITGVGHTVNSLRKMGGELGDAATKLIWKWKEMVVNTDTSDEACVSDVAECYESPDDDSEPNDDNSTTTSSISQHARPEALLVSPPLSLPVGLDLKMISLDLVNAAEISKRRDETMVSDSHKKATTSDSSNHSSKHLPNKDMSSKKDSKSKSSSDRPMNSRDNHKSYKSSKSLKAYSEINGDCEKEKSKIKSLSHCSVSRNEKHSEEKKRKYDASSSDRETERKKFKLDSKEDEHEGGKNDNFTINVDRSLSARNEQLLQRVEEEAQEQNLGPRPSTSRTKSPVLDTVKNKSLSLLASNVKLKLGSQIKNEGDQAATLPETRPHNKALPPINPELNEHNMIICQRIKRQPTKYYSGKTSTGPTVPTFSDLCIRVLIKNIDALESTGGAPYDTLKPLLERATPTQLLKLEHHNPYLIEKSDPLWQFHCNKHFGTKKREEMESWREMYRRCFNERETRLQSIKEKIKRSIHKSTPVRSTKVVAVDNVSVSGLRKKSSLKPSRSAKISSYDKKVKALLKKLK